MNIESTNINKTQQAQTRKNSSVQNTNREPEIKFADELKSEKKVEQNESKKDIQGPKDIEQSGQTVDMTNVDPSEQNDPLEGTQKPKDVEQSGQTVDMTNVDPSEQNDPLEGTQKQKDIEQSEQITNVIKANDSKKINVLEKSETTSKYNQVDLNNNLEDKNSIKKLNKAVEGLNSIVKEFNQSEDKLSGYFKNDKDFVDNNDMINNDMNIQENKDILPQMNPNMNFSGNGQPFSSFMNNDSESNPSGSTLSSSAQELAEEAAILSTMAENIAMANRNQVLKDTNTVTNEEDIKKVVLTKQNQKQPLNDTKIVINEKGIKKVDSQTGIKIENIVKYDTVVMNEADVEVFANLVENGEINMNNLAPKAAEKSIQVSKTLADMLAKSMETNQPVRINFDNDISVIIRISRDGKITADFLPSSQVAEAYLKENIPLLKQRFDENNIDYESLNQRERRNSDKENNRKKDRSNE